MGTIHVIFNGSSCSSWTELRWEQSNVHERVRGRDQEFLQHYSEIGIGKFWRNPGCESHWQQWSIMGKSRDISSTVDQVGRSKSSRTLRLGLMLRKVSEPAEAAERWKGQNMECQTDVSEQLYAIDGEPIEFEWNIFPGCTSLELLQKIQECLMNRYIDPVKKEIELSSCPCSTTLIRTRKTMKKNAFQIPKKSEIMRRDSCEDIGRSLFVKAWWEMELRGSTNATMIWRDKTSNI